jgi:hypothetical protein
MWMYDEWKKGVSLKKVRRRASKEFKLSDKKLKDLWTEHKTFCAEFRAAISAAFEDHFVQGVSQL